MVASCTEVISTMLRNIILFFMLGSFHRKVESSEAITADDPMKATTNDTILELYSRLRKTENPSLKEVEAIKTSDTIKSYFGRIIGEFCRFFKRWLRTFNQKSHCLPLHFFPSSS